MKLSEFSFDTRLSELLPAAAAPAPGMQAAPGAAPKPGQPQQAAGLASGQMDPAQAAQAAKDKIEQKKQIQDQIKQTEAQLNDLRKRLAELG
jgi:hypothetical protein